MTRPLLKLRPEVQEDEYSYLEQTYAGFGASAIMCNAPLNYQGNFNKNLSTSLIKDEYSCTSDKLPFDEFPGWDDPLQYSPMCRDWYLNSNDRPNQNFFTEAYLFANEPIMSISTCAPFFKEGYSNKNIYGTSCIDINP